MLQRVQLRRSDIIVPVFVTEGSGVSKPVASMPGVSQLSVDRCVEELTRRAEQGFGAYLIFGVIDRDRKDATGSPALDPDNVVCRLLRESRLMSASARGIYCTGGYEASRKVSARMVSAMTLPPAVTRTRLGFGAMVMGWSGPGIFMGSLLWVPRHIGSRRDVCPRDPHACRR